MSDYVSLPEASPDVHLLQFGYVALRHWTHPRLSDWFWRIYWNSSPGASVICKQHEYPLDPHLLTVIPPHSVFVPHAPRPAYQFFIHFTIKADISVMQEGIYQWPVDDRDLAILIPLTERVGDRWSDRFRRDMALYELILKTLQRIPPTHWKWSLHDARIATVVNSLRNHSGPPLTNERLAHEANMSTNGFIRLFHRVMGTPPQRFQMISRLERAGSDLLHTRDSIESIAERYGFCDRAHFTKVFRQHFPAGPAEYRKQPGRSPVDGGYDGRRDGDQTLQRPAKRCS